MRDKESGGLCRLIPKYPSTFASAFVILEGETLCLNGWCEPARLKLDRPFFTVC